MQTEILSLLPQEIAEKIPTQPKYRAEQIFEWLHKKNAQSFSEMLNLPKELREELDANFHITMANVIEKQVAESDGTTKFLTTLNGAYAESVLMRYKHGNSVCISTQAGCKMGCKFCASGESGFQRDFSAAEYLAQVYNCAPVKNIVLMGCGEPLDNFDETIRFIELITHPKGANISGRNITVSTCGLVPQIYSLAEKRLQITLAISLHAPTDEIRQSIMPIAKTYPLQELLTACRHYAEKTRRRLTFEYALTKDLNDSPTHAKTLAKLLQGLLCHVNLIPINKTSANFSPTPHRTGETFANILLENKIPTTIRRSLGGEIDAACGQLRSKYA
ncbi:MAG: 23S rRNA (adenine(2503)-C(2))-methyltransferase RlmN [Defluviitaleaceae bacterium]|nr:23S rRNA (adenine(2503)-C(2))-methyltransferase RlmN [Defluviitaleaceae bacterium]MCL2261821.1 23S rRNA (adenine(2503)-C(2))-methyltransferase RlmN [Defluviitaleaceae bacterium]